MSPSTDLAVDTDRRRCARRNTPTPMGLLRRSRSGGALARMMLVATTIVVLTSACSNGGTPGTAWGDGSFSSNGERIYFTGTSESGDDIDFSGGPDTGGMMINGQLSCASCHATDAQGGTHRMHTAVMEAPNIRWVALAAEDEHAEDAGDAEHAEEYGMANFRTAVVDGVHADGEPLSGDMPRWRMSEADLQDLVEYLQSFEAP